MKIISNSVKETLNLGALLARHLQAGDIICLQGDLGTGKTTLTKGIAEGLGVSRAEVTSSSFILIRQHLEGRVPLFHFDLYRLKEACNIAVLGYEEYFYGEGVSVIEWAENLKYLMPKERLMVELSYHTGDKRAFNFAAIGVRYKELLGRLREDTGH